jgi:hypothetical protein
MSTQQTRAATQGQGLIEYALILPIFLMLTFGIIEMSWLVYTNHTLANATREGARFAMVRGEMSGNVATSEAVGEVVSERAPGLGGPVTTAIEFIPNAQPGSQVSVSTTYQYQPLIGMILGTDPITLENRSTVIVQY